MQMSLITSPAAVDLRSDRFRIYPLYPASAFLALSRTLRY
jgi:hypothetical protein